MRCAVSGVGSVVRGPDLGAEPSSLGHVESAGAGPGSNLSGGRFHIGEFVGRCRESIEGSAGQSCEGWQYTFEVRGQVSRTFNTTGPDRSGSRTKNGNDDAPSGLRATTKSSTPRP